MRHQVLEGTGVLNICLRGLCVFVYVCVCVCVYIYIYTYIHIFFFVPPLPVALRPNAGQCLLMLEVSRPHTTTHHSR